MECPECGAEIPETALLCPECGRLTSQTQPMPRVKPPQQQKEDKVAKTQKTKKASKAKQSTPTLIWAMIFLCIFALVIGGSAYYGVYRGERDREQRHDELAEEHYQLGLERLNDGQYELAIAEFKYALKLDPDHQGAQEALAQTEARLSAIPTPTRPSTDTNEIDAEYLYGQAVVLYDNEQWKEAAEKFIQLRAYDASYEAETVEEMLFDSLYNAGMSLLDEDRFEEGLFYLDQAIALRPLDEEAKRQRDLARMYLTAMGFWGVDWARCINEFNELYTVEPNYKDVFQRLYQARVNYATVFYEQDEMCPAAEQYAKAIQMTAQPDPTVQGKREEADMLCSQATPTPVATVEGTDVITLTNMPEGFNAGRLAFPLYNSGTGSYDVFSLFADKRLVKLASNADQPTWVWNDGRLGYRNIGSSSVSLLNLGQGGAQRVTVRAGLMWPTFSPDGTRVAYSAKDEMGQWQIYIAPTDGSAEPVVHAAGKGPAWAPNGLLAWTGCDESGECGIIVDNPDDDQAGTRLTASINDIAIHWAPGGDLLAYMSNFTGDWEIYLLSVGGGVVRLTENSANDGLPAWAPDGSSIAFVSDREGSWSLYLMDPNGENPRKVMDLGRLPSWTNQRISWAP